MISSILRTITEFDHPHQFAAPDLRFFLTVCIDQMVFMESLIQPDRLRARILIGAGEETRLGKLPAKAGNVLSQSSIAAQRRCGRGGCHW
jgi:hypothetical protein